MEKPRKELTIFALKQDYPLILFSHKLAEVPSYLKREILGHFIYLIEKEEKFRLSEQNQKNNKNQDRNQ